MYFVFWWHDARCSCTWDFWDWSIHWAFLSSWIYVVYLRKSHRWTHLVFFWGARKLYLLTLCRHSDQVLKESWMAKLATCIYDDCVDFWILAVWFSTFSTLTCHINKKINVVVGLELWVVVHLDIDLLLAPPKKCHLFEAWIQFLLSFLVNLFAAIVFVLVINHMARAPGYHGFCWRKLQRHKVKRNMFCFWNVWISKFFLFLNHWSIDLSIQRSGLGVCKNIKNCWNVLLQKNWSWAWILNSPCPTKKLWVICFFSPGGFVQDAHNLAVQPPSCTAGKGPA